MDVCEQNGWFTDKYVITTEKCVSVQRLILTYSVPINFIAILLRMINVYASLD